MSFVDGLVAKVAAWAMQKAVVMDPGFFANSSIYGDLQPQRMANNYPTWAKEGYRNNDSVYKCISYLSRNASLVDWGLFTDRTLKKEIDAHPILDRWNNPNPEQDRSEFVEDWAGTLLLSGNGFINAGYLTQSPNPNTEPDALFVMRPDWVEVIPSKQGVIGYTFGSNDYDKVAMLPFQVAHTKYWAPDDLLRGLSPIEVAAIFVDMQTAGNRWNLALMQNGAKPTGTWTTDQMLTKQDFETLKNDLYQKYSGIKNAGKPPVLYGGLKWMSMTIPPAELDWLNSRAKNAADIANIYNLAPMLIGDTASTTFNNMEEAKLASYLEAVFPMVLNKLQATANRWLVPKYAQKGSLFLAYKPESVPAIQKVVQAALAAQSDRGTKLYASGQITLDESRELSGFAPLPNGIGQIYKIGGILVKQSNLDAYADQSMQKPAAPPPAIPEPELDNPPAPAQPGGKPDDSNANPAGKPAPNPADSQPGNSGKSGRLLPYRLRPRTKALDLETAEQKATYAASVEQGRKKWEDDLTSRLQDYFAQEQQVIHHAIDQAALPSTAALRVETALKAQEPHLKAMLNQAYQDMAADFIAETAKQFKSYRGRYARKQTLVDTLDANTIAYLLTLAGQKVTQIDDTTLALLQAALAEGVAAGESIPNLAKRVDQLYLDQIIPNRSTTIARTEVLGASNYGSMVAAKSSGLTLNKVWLSTEDARTRPAHAQADGQEVGMDEKFVVDGEELDFPGDPSASAGNIINCRCTPYYKRVQSPALPGDDSEKAIIPMRPRRERYPGYREMLRGVAR